MKRKAKKILSLLLTASLILTMLPSTAFASVKASASNTAAQNSEILTQLSGLTGGDSDEAYGLLNDLGLLDEDGNLDVNQSILLDGRSMTLDEVMALLEDPSTDLSRVADVDGVPIALGDLKTMIQIEQELTRIKATYFSGKTFTKEQLASLDDLMNEIQTEGITAKSLDLQSTQSSGLVLTVTPDPDNPTDLTYSGAPITLVYTLALSGTMPSQGTVGFSWRTVSGLDFFGVELKAETTVFNMLRYQYSRGTFTFGVEGSGADFLVNDPSNFTGTLTVMIGKTSGGLEYSIEELLGCNVLGRLRGFVEFYDGDGVSFSDGSSLSGLYTIPVELSKPDAFEDGTTWTTSMDGLSDHDRTVSSPDDLGYNEKLNPRWDLIDQNDTEMKADYLTLKKTANEIFGGGPCYYQTNARLYIYDPGVISSGYMKYAMPLPVGSTDFSSGDLIQYQWTNSVNGPSGPLYNLLLESDPLRCDTGSILYPYIPISKTINAAEARYVSVVMSYSDGFPPLKMTTIWPKNPTFSTGPGNEDGDISLTNAAKQYTVSSSLSVYDKDAPTVKSVDIPAGIYSTGQYVPITLTFSEPVDASELSLSINGSLTAANELLMDTEGSKAVAMYRVKDVDGTEINISSITNIKDLMGNKTPTDNHGGAGWTFSDVELKSTLMKNAVTGISVIPATLQSADIADGVTVKLTLKQAAAYIGAYTDYNNKKRKAPFAVQLTKNGTVVERLDTTLNDTGGTFSASAQITGFSVATADKTYTAEVIAYESDTDTTGTLVLGKSADFTVKALIYVDGVTVTYPADNKQQLSLAESYRPKLGVAFANNPTYTTGTWISGDPEIATIAADGQVSLTGSKIGYVHFTFTADDGGLASTSDRDPNPKHVKDATSMDYEVVAGGIPSLVIPGETNRFTVRLGSDAEVRWSSNVNFSATDDFDYTIELFEGNFSEFQLGGKTVQYSATAAKNENSAVIPYSELTTLSVNGAPAYTVRISAPDPLITGATISALCYIVVNPLAAVVHLQRPASLYMLDDGALYINWTIDNFTRDRTDADLLIKKISTDANGNDISTTYLGVGDWPIDAASDSYWLKPDPVTGLKDTYMVTLQARNPGDAGYSADSFVLYVYHDGALQLEVAGQKGKELSLRMDNESKVSGTLPTDTADIMELREELALIEYVGINYHDYSWSQLKDGIKWSSSDADTLRVNYRQGGLYEDISKFSMDTYLPETKMALSSVTDGTALITATHANTGMQASAEVEVKTLREKFYLFRLSPAQQTELTYMDGKGVQKTVRTNSEGVLALYEPDGIDSDVQLKAVNGGSVWLGTIYQSSLLSGERDATRLQLYPLNAFKLRQAAKVEIHLQKPDGSPYTGSVTLRGGVYKNDGYCQDARMLGNMVPDAGHPLKDGKSAQSVVIGPDGKLTVYMDSTQFWSQANGETDAAGASLQSTDNLQYLFELTDMSGYFPLLVFANGNLGFNDLMRSAGSVISLESCATGSPRPFVSNQTVDYGLSGSRLIDVRGSTGHIGPNDTYPQVNLLTTVLLWGQDVQKTYQLQICDEFGYVPAAQSSQIVTYPFSSIPVIRNTLVMSNDTISKSGWVAAGKDVGLRVRLAQEGAMLMELPLSSRLTDLTQVPKLKDTGDITGLMLDLQGKSGLGAGAQMSDGNKIINGLMGLMGKISGPVDGSNFKMLITPGDDNAVFNAFIWAGYNSLGLDEVDYDQNGLAFDYQLAESNLSTAPSLNSLTEMARGSYDPTQTYDEGKANQGRGKGTGSTDFGGQLEGYFEAQIQYNFDAGKWEIYLLGGGTTAGFGASYTYNVNGQAGPVPLTATFTVGGAIQLDFKVAARYSEKSGYEWADTVTGNAVNDYLTTLRINAYVNAFGGIGFDYSVVALKIGLFGKLGVDNQNKFLSRTYLADTTLRQLNGQAIQLSGEVGIKFVAQFLFISYDLVLASGSLAYTRQFNEWDSITDYWNNTGSGLRMLMVNAAQNDLVPVSSSATLQSRDYLEEFARSWGVKNRVSLMALDSPNALATLQTNAYPYSLPLVTGDGELLLYAFDGDSADVGDTRIYATNQSGGSYPEGAAIAAPPLDPNHPDPANQFTGYGDSGLSLAGSGSFAAAAWVRQSASLPGKSGQTLSSAEQALLMNGTEIVASIYKNGAWSSTRLTFNASPDLAPVVATNGSKVLVAWRSVYAGNSADLLNFSQQDNILYSIYSDDDVNGGWSMPKQLYNGTSGAVKGISAAMLASGAAAVAYTLDTNVSDGLFTDYETGYAVVDTAGKPGFSAIVTQDEWLDENPQIAAVTFAPGDERFVLGWHSVRNELSDIRLAAIDGAGALSNSFIESISQVAGGNAVNIDGDFRFAKMNGALNDLSNLSIVWSESRTNGAGEADHGILRAVKFSKDGNDISLSAALDTAELPARTLLDHFDAYVSGADGKTVKAVIQGSEYKVINPNDPTTYDAYPNPDGGPDVLVAKEEVKLFTATETYANKVRLTALAADYANLSLNTPTPVQFTVLNAGLDVINSVEINIEGQTTTFDSLDLHPNESAALTSWYPVGRSIENLDYTLTAYFGTASDTLSGTVYLDYPDLGVSQMKVTSEEEGIRTLQITLYNGSAATLAGDKNRSVRLGFYDDAPFTEIQSVTTSMPGVTVNADKTLTVSGEDALRLIDEGAFTFEVSFDIGRYVTDKNLSEIPDSGIRFYVNARAEENIAILPEYSNSNNSASVMFDSPAARSGQPVSLSVEQGLTGGSTTAGVTLHNNSLSNSTTGNLIVSLLDSGGNVLEQKQTYTGDSGSFIALDGEETANRTFTFTQSGNRVAATYGSQTLADGNAALAALSFEGLAVRLSDFIPDGNDNYVFTAPETTLSSTLVSFMTKGAGATVKVNGESASGGKNVAIPLGNSEIILEVTAANRNTTRSYILSVSRGTAAPVTYTVTFSSNGLIYATRTVKAGAHIGSAVWPADPTRSNYTFEGWFTSENGVDSQFTSSTSVSATMTVHANWTYSDDGSSGEDSSSAPSSVYQAIVKIGNGNEISLPVTIDTVKRTASVDFGAQDITLDGTVITIPPIPGVDTYLVGIPVPKLSAADRRAALTIHTAAGSLNIMPDMLTGVAGINGSKAEISIGLGDKNALPAGLKAAVGERPLISLSLLIDGKQTDWNNPASPLTVSIPYTLTAAELANPESIVIWYIDGSGNAAAIPNGHYDSATGTVTFSTPHVSDYAVVYNKVSFHDVTASAWYRQAVSFIAARNITSGTGDRTTYSPNAKLTRGEFLVLMMRAFGIAPDENPVDNFADAGNTHYTGYLAAAKRLGISAGVGNNRYAPGNRISRQETFTLLYNALKVTGQLPTGDSGKAVSDFTDTWQIASWAQDAMTLLVETGAVGGSDGMLNPTGTTTRAEMAQVLYNLLNK